MYEKPLSVNKAYKNVAMGRKGFGRTKTGDYKRFTTKVIEFLNIHCTKPSPIENPFYLESNLVVYCPTKEFYTLKGDISIVKGDAFNYRKCLQDIVSKWMCIDDKYIVSGCTRQFPAKEWAFTLEITCHKGKVTTD